MHLHSAIQQAVGWQNCHLYEFLDGNVEENDNRPLDAMKMPRIARSKDAEPHDDVPDAPNASSIELQQLLSANNRGVRSMLQSSKQEQGKGQETGCWREEIDRMKAGVARRMAA